MIQGIVVGAFDPYTEAHGRLVRAARAQVDALTVVVASQPGDPVDGRERHGWVHRAHRECRVAHLDDAALPAPGAPDAAWASFAARVRQVAGPADRLFSAAGLHTPAHPALAAALDARVVTIPLHPPGVDEALVRANPMRHWDALPAEVRPHFLRRVAILGAESTGKTTLSRRLAEALGTVWVEEYGRLYCETRDAMALVTADFEAIAWGQAAWEDEAATHATRVLICDTELHTTNTWADLVTGSRPAWMTEAAIARHYDLVLLLGNEVPWAHDGVRVLEARREEHLRRLEAELRLGGRDYVRVEGSGDARFARALELVRALIA